MDLLYVLLLVLWPAFNSSDAWYPYYHTTNGTTDSSHAWNITGNNSLTDSSHAWNITGNISVTDSSHAWNITGNISVTDSPDVRQTTTNTDLPVPNITVYRQKENKEHVIVLCKVDMEHYMYRPSITLSVESEVKYTMENKIHFSFTAWMFMVTVSSPASFTCENKVYYKGDVKKLRSHTYTYEWSVLDHHEEGVSSFYICFSSFIAVGLVIMTAAVIVTTIRSKAKDSINHTTTVADGDYMNS
ncbi:uncharacterized protein LOC125279946 isoform X2 [Megalobrama amblycephala]|uniref:uncharacterized protein LOC125279946 isoform X2 n=1 Tax=Megalobrama amblycephala TaxID=75352 RepID=UPI002013CE2B|nr:uncharacterized protein LOC125279946 isoform X2 [Megalobrama amblycephala]